jgi:acyl carrier protein
MNNYEKLKELILDILLIDPEEFSLNLKREDVDTWDSLGVVSMAVGVEETFGYHFTPEEATSIEKVQDIIDILDDKGISFHA